MINKNIKPVILLVIHLFDSLIILQISMPSGAHVTAQLWHWPDQPSKYYMDVVVYPISEDRSQGSGLCGNYDGNKEDDLTPNGSTVPDIVLTLIYGSLQYVPKLFPISYQ